MAKRGVRKGGARALAILKGRAGAKLGNRAAVR